MGHYTGTRTPGKAKHVISLFLSGGPSQVDMFDPKPLLVKFEGQRPGSVDLRTERQTGGLDALAVHVQEVRAERDRSQRRGFEDRAR